MPEHRRASALFLTDAGVQMLTRAARIDAQLKTQPEHQAGREQLQLLGGELAHGWVVDRLLMCVNNCLAKKRCAGCPACR